MKTYTEQETIEAILHNPVIAKKMAITGVMLVAYKYVIERSEATTADLAWHLKVSSQYASITLRKLYEKGYLNRAQEVSKSGGYEWVYSPAFNDINKGDK